MAFHYLLLLTRALCCGTGAGDVVARCLPVGGEGVGAGNAMAFDLPCQLAPNSQMTILND
eukprot:8371253-Pyramimonas_sp.AAC.1